MYANEIELIEPGTFRNVPLLSHIDLGRIKLRYLDQSVVQSFSTVSHFYLHDNPWNCDCNLLVLHDLFSKVQLSSNGQMPKCESPGELRGKRWEDLSSDEFKCDLKILVPKNNSKVG
ncbi:kekkon 4 [Carabus blaptoides fortunei]